MNQDSVIIFLQTVFNEEFRNASVNGWFQTNGQTNSGNLNNLFHLGTRYYAQSEDKKYLHFTKAENAVNILKSGCLWLQNLNSFSDKLEFNLAATQLLGMSDESQLALKDKLFAACFTELNEKQNIHNDFPYHWTRYSNERKGVSLEFEFGPKYIFDAPGVDPVLHEFYYLMKVQYHQDIGTDEVLVRLKNEIDRIKSTAHFSTSSLAEFLFPLLCAHKREKTENESYSSEKEIRLFYCNSICSRDCDFYSPNTEEDTFSGSAQNPDSPFRQLPFNTSKTFLNLKAVYLGDSVTDGYKSSISELASMSGIRVIEKL